MYVIRFYKNYDFITLVCLYISKENALFNLTDI